jgi:hypothetical protein
LSFSFPLFLFVYITLLYKERGGAFRGERFKSPLQESPSPLWEGIPDEVGTAKGRHKASPLLKKVSERYNPHCSGEKKKLSAQALGASLHIINLFSCNRG